MTKLTNEQIQVYMDMDVYSLKIKNAGDAIREVLPTSDNDKYGKYENNTDGTDLDDLTYENTTLVNGGNNWHILKMIAEMRACLDKMEGFVNQFEALKAQNKPSKLIIEGFNEKQTEELMSAVQKKLQD